MNPVEELNGQPETICDFGRMAPPIFPQASTPTAGVTRKPRINVDPANVRHGLGQLVLTLIKLVHELLERQAMRRIEAGSLTGEEVERLGLTLMLQAQEIDRLRDFFGLAEEDLNLNLGPLGRLL